MDRIHDAGRSLAGGRQIRFPPQPRRALDQGSWKIEARRDCTIRHGRDERDRREFAQSFPEREHRARRFAEAHCREAEVFGRRC